MGPRYKTMKCTVCPCSLEGHVFSVGELICDNTIVKDTVHPKIKIQSLSTHRHADGQSAEFHCPQKFFGASHRQRCSILLNN